MPRGDVNKGELTCFIAPFGIDPVLGTRRDHQLNLPDEASSMTKSEEGPGEAKQLKPAKAWLNSY